MIIIRLLRFFQLLEFTIKIFKHKGIPVSPSYNICHYFTLFSYFPTYVAGRLGLYVNATQTEAHTTRPAFITAKYTDFHKLCRMKLPAGAFVGLTFK